MKTEEEIRNKLMQLINSVNSFRQQHEYDALVKEFGEEKSKEIISFHIYSRDILKWVLE
jgi:hypothetical protein